ncbi:MAG: hypothetical protein AVDCRST_MAG95-3687, partial [uncultured Adhaeribacter sp.]
DQTIFPLFIFAILSASYLSYHKLSKLTNRAHQPLENSDYTFPSLQP